jgi:hypothetical protein
VNGLQFPQLPPSFYDSTPYLRHIRQAAHALRVAPDAVLVATLCRVAAATPPTTYIDTPEPTPLNLIGALIAAPGNGKSLANSTAFRLVPDLGLGVNDSLPLGTGEGLVESYFESISVINDTGKGKHIEKRQAFKSGYFYCDEGETLFTLTTRKGATILQTLRTAWSGGVLGNTNANVETRRKLERNSYRACVVVAFQPSCGSALVADSHGGTPQRFIFASATDIDMPTIAPSVPGVLGYDATNEPVAIQVHAEILRELDTNKVNRARGTVQVDALDTHVDYNRLRVAAIFALLDRRQFIDLSHWNLATMVLDNSRQVRRTLDSWATLNRRDEVDAQENERNYVDGQRETNKHTRNVNRLADNLVRMVERQPGELTQPQALNRIRIDRHQVTSDEIMAAVMATNRIEIKDKRLHLRHKT